MQPLPLSPLAERPLVSILISCYNYARYVEEAVRSALDQTYSHVEVIAVDDGSTDESRTILRRLASNDARLQVIEQANAGQAVAMNVAVARSQGEVLCFLDADDMFESEKCQRVLETLHSTPSAGFLAHSYTVVDAAGKAVRTEHQLPTPGWQADALLRQGGAVPNVPPTSALTLRRSVANRIFPLDPSFQIAADGAIQRLSPFLTSIAVVEEPLMRYRIHGRNGLSELSSTVEGLDRTLNTNRSIHQLQRSFLEDEFGGSVAAGLESLEADPGWLLLLTHRAALTGPPAAFAQAARRAAAHPQNRVSRFAYLYRLIASLPPPMGRGLWRMAFSEGAHKLLLRTIRSRIS